MERYHIYKLGLAILFYMVYCGRKAVVNGQKLDDVTSTSNTTDYRERRDSGDETPVFYQGDGTPGVDYPTLSYVPRTKFSCRDMEAGYYADLETDCQAFHICDEGRKLSFLCPNGTIFHQSELICDWWFKVNCSTSPLLYEESAEILHRESARRKEQRRYQGTKHGVFSNKEDYDYKDSKDYKIHGTPAHFVTPSYPHKVSLKTFDNRISASTEGSIRRNYNIRGDRKLDSIGNGVKESTSRFSGGSGENAFDVNLQQKLDDHGKTTFSGSGQTTGGRENGFGRKSEGSKFGASTRKPASSFDRGRSPFDRSSQDVQAQDRFSSNLQDNVFGSGQKTGSGQNTNVQEKPYEQKPFGGNFGGKSTSTGGRTTFSANVQEKQYDHKPFSNNLRGKATDSGRTSTGGRTSFSANVQEKQYDQNGDNLGGKATDSGQTSAGGRTSFGTNIQEKPIGGNLGRKETAFGQTSTSRRTSFGTNVQEEPHEQKPFGGRATASGQSNVGGRASFGTGVQEKSDSAGQVSYDESSEQASTERNLFGTRLQEKTSSSKQNIFDSNIQAKPDNHRQTYGSSQQQGRFGQNAFGRTTPSSYNKNSFSSNPQGKLGGREEFTSTTTQQRFGGTESRFGSTQETFKEREQGKFSTPSRSKLGGAQFNTFEAKSEIGGQQTPPSTHLSDNRDNIKFSISSHGKFDDFNQRAYGTSTSEKPTIDHQNTFGSSQGVLGGVSQNRFDVGIERKPEEQTTNRFGISFQGNDYTTTAGRLSVSTTSGEMQEPQETASFVKNFRNNIPNSNVKQITTNAYPNHRETYSEIKDPRFYHERPLSKLPDKPFYGTSISPKVLSTIPVSTQTGSFRTTTETSPQTRGFNYNFGFKSDTSTTKEPFAVGGREQFAVSKSEETKSSSTSNMFDFSLQPTQQSTFKSGKEDNVYNKEYVDGIDVSLNSVSSTLQPDLLNEAKGKSTAFPGSQSSSYYDGKLFGNGGRTGSETSTPAVGISTYSYSKLPTTGRPHTDRPLINLNIIPSTALPGFEPNNRLGKAFGTESPKIQIIQSPKSQSYDKSPFIISKNQYEVDSKDQGFTGSIAGKTGSIFPTVPTNTFEVTTAAGLTPSVRFGDITSSTTSGTASSIVNELRYTPTNEYNNQNTPTIQTNRAQFTINSESHSTTPFSGGASIHLNINNETHPVPTTQNVNIRTDFDAISTLNSRASYGESTTPTIQTNRAQFTINSERHSTTPFSGGASIHLNINNETHPVPTTQNINIRTDFDAISTLNSRASYGESTTPVTETERNAFGVTINDQAYTTLPPTPTDRYEVNINDQTYSTPASGLLTTGQNEFGNTATTATPPESQTQTTENALYTSFSSVLQPKPFSFPTKSPSVSLNSISPTISNNNISPDVTLSGRTGASEIGVTVNQQGVSQTPFYKVSSASPFSPMPQKDRNVDLKTPAPTLPTPYTTISSLLHPSKSIDENVNNMINTLVEVVRQRLNANNSDNGFGTPRPGLVVPPSAGPQTLHSLAIYFANALDNLTSSSPREYSETTDEEGETDSPIIHIDNEELIQSLLTQMTLNNYEHLFKENDITTTEATVALRTGADDSENDLLRDDTKYPVTEGPPVRQLARVFTEALSAYLEDPDTFRKVLHDVRPTEPPLSTTEGETSETDEDEVLNYSDSDLKSDHPHLPTRPTGIPVSPTWGYILAFNKSLSNSDNLESRNSLNPENENLQSADSQSFVSQFNKVTKEYKTTAPVPKHNVYNCNDGTSTTTESYKGAEGTSRPPKSLPENHWTTSSDVTKLWQTTLLINPAALNENFDATKTASDVDSRSAQLSGVTSSEENSSETSEENSSEASNLTTVSEIQYELRSLPKIELNSTQVHGILIDFMNATKTEGGAKLQRILHKLNISEDEFLNKMKEIEGNPLTRRLILLLISECNTDKNKELEARAAIPEETKSFSSGSQQGGIIETETESVSDVTETNLFKQIVHPSLEDEDEDTRALELLNSLYVIASKFGK